MSMRRLDIAEFVEEVSLVADKRAIVNRAIQISLDRVFESHDFPFYLQEGEIRTVDDYVSTSTIYSQVTNDSASVVGVGTTFTSVMVGRKVRFNNETPYYRIKSVTNTTLLTLEHPFQGTTDTTAEFVIYQDEYRLPSDVYKYKVMRQMQNGIPLFSYQPTGFDRMFPSPQSYGDPIYEIMSGTKLDTYTTGTVSATGTTITGIGTGWVSVEGLGRMSTLRIGDNVYHVKSVNSDTQITTFETVTTITGNNTYEILLDNLVVQFHQIPNSARLIYFRYFRLPSILANNYDLPDMPHQFHYLLCWGTLAEILAHKGDINKAENVYETKFLNGLVQMKLSLGSFTPDRTYKRKSTDRLTGRINDGLENANFDCKYSMPY